ncbi:MAG: hypothetical protein ACQKBV_01545 [Puniceicoccales bacterium]
MLRIYCVTFLLLALVPMGAWANYHTLTNSSGVEIEAELLEVADKNGAPYLSFVRKADQREFSIPLSTLSVDTQSEVRKWWQAEEKRRLMLSPGVDLGINFKRNRKKKQLYNSVYSDEDLYTYTPEVEIENDDLYRSFKGVTVHIVCLAQHTYYKTHRVVSATKRKADLPRNGTAVVVGDSYSFENYKSDYADFEYGWEDAGYLIVVKNTGGEVTHWKTDRSELERNIERSLKFERGDYLSSDLSQKRRSYTDR